MKPLRTAAVSSVLPSQITKISKEEKYGLISAMSRSRLTLIAAASLYTGTITDKFSSRNDAKTSVRCSRACLGDWLRKESHRQGPDLDPYPYSNGISGRELDSAARQRFAITCEIQEKFNEFIAIWRASHSRQSSELGRICSQRVDQLKTIIDEDVFR